ncbi:MAG: type II toxin-antitoxin system VapC family toxin [Caulobacteraceae bacterium]
MIVAVDASAIVAVGLDEPERSAFLTVLDSAERAFVSPINIVEAGLVIVLRQRLMAVDDFGQWLARLGLVEQTVTGDAALRAYLLFGRGVHRAGLNLGDCFAYALAKQLNAPLLFKGDDFAYTDVKRAVQPI